MHGRFKFDGSIVAALHLIVNRLIHSIASGFDLNSGPRRHPGARPCHGAAATQLGPLPLVHLPGGEREDNRIMRSTLNDEAVAQDAFAPRSGFFSDALAGSVFYRRHDFQSVQPEFVHTEARGQFDGGGRDAATAVTGSNPITEIRKTVNVIDAVDANA